MNILKINGTALTGIYVDAAVSFNKPAKRVETFSVPGRNGDLVIDEGTFDNVLISYPVYEKSTFPDEFDAIVNWLASLQGYQRIECSNDPQHYRLGRFVVPEAPTAKRLNKDGYYTLTFDCKPQRWLLSGEEDTEITANPSTEYTGDVASFTANALDEITELTAEITPVQSGTGDPSPDNIRPITGWTGANVTRAGENLFGGNLMRDGVLASMASATDHPDDRYVSFASTATTSQTITKACGLSGKFKENTQYTFILTLRKSSGTDANLRIYYTDSTYTSISVSAAATKETVVVVTAANKTVWTLNKVNSGGTTSLYYDESGIFEGVLTAADFKAYLGTTYPISLGQTVYGGTLNVTTGVLTIDKVGVNMGNASWNIYTSGGVSAFYANFGEAVNTNPNGTMDILLESYKPISSRSRSNYMSQSSDFEACHITNNSAVYIRDSRYTTEADFKTAVTGQILVVAARTPITVQLTPTEITTLLGVNNIWADTGDITVTVTGATVFNNPSSFNSKPLIRAYGTGAFRINDITVTIASHDKPYIDIDCELQECYYESTNMNSYVTFSGNDYPELVPDDNYVLMVGVTKLDITPRWWIL